MKSPLLYITLVCAGLMTMSGVSPAQTASPAVAGASGPRMAFVTNEYHFGKVMAGEKVKYTFILTNIGDQVLVISNVAPGCHCTTVGNWATAHQIEPGKTGEIPIQFDSGSFRGDVHKSILVTSNDKLEPRKTLMLVGTISRPLEISPQMARINVMPDAASNASTVIHITSQYDEPITLSEPSSANGKFQAELKTITPGKEFEVTITAVPPFTTGNTVGTVSVHTSLTNMPIVNITVVAVVQAAVFVSPMQIPLPPELSRGTTNMVRITANTTAPLVLSDLTVTDQRINVTLKEITPGKVYQLEAAFPPGFTVPAGQTVRITVKSNNPQYPLISVPVVQFPRRASNAPAFAQPRIMTQNPPATPVGHP